MAGSIPREILFVFHGQKQSKRNQELQDARRRAHAARYASRKTKELTTPAPKSVDFDGDLGFQDVQRVIQRPQRGPVRRYPALPPIESLLGQDDDASLTGACTIVSPLSILSQDMTDPFQTTIISTLPNILQRYLHDAQTLIWPSMVPLVPPSHAACFYRRSPIDSPREIDYQIDAAAAISLQYVRSTDASLLRQIAAIGRKHREQSIAWVNSNVVNAQGPPPSNVVAALLSLVSHSGLSRPGVPGRWKASPMAMGEFSGLFGASRVLLEDLRFLWQVVELKGGDHWVGSDAVDEELPLRLMLNHFDVFVSTRLGTPPMWHTMASVPPAIMAQYSPSPETSPPPNNPPDIHHPTNTNDPFSHLLHNLSLISTILTMQSATHILNLFTTRSPAAPPYSVLIHTRNMAQHQILMLYDGPSHSNICTTAPKLTGTTKLEGLDGIAHAAALLFSDLVLFPLPAGSGARPRLLQELLGALKAYDAHKRRPTATGSSLTPQQAPEAAMTTVAPGAISGLASTSTSAPPAPTPRKGCHSPSHPLSKSHAQSPSRWAASSPPPPPLPPPLVQQRHQPQPTALPPHPQPSTSQPHDRRGHHSRHSIHSIHSISEHQETEQQFLLWATLLLAIGSLTHDYTACSSLAPHFLSSPASRSHSHSHHTAPSSIKAEIKSYTRTSLLTHAAVLAIESTSRPQSGSWETLQQILKRFLWWDHVLEEPAREVWRGAIAEGAKRRG